MDCNWNCLTLFRGTWNNFIYSCFRKNQLYLIFCCCSSPTAAPTYLGNQHCGNSPERENYKEVFTLGSTCACCSVLYFIQRLTGQFGNWRWYRNCSAFCIGCWIYVGKFYRN